MKVSKKDWIAVNGMHEAIITQVEFDCAQAALYKYVERKGKPGNTLLRKKSVVVYAAMP